MCIVSAPQSCCCRALSCQKEEIMIWMNLIGMEKLIIMEPKTKTETPGAKRRRLPEEYICIAPDESPQVFDWLNGAEMNGEKEVAEVHLRLCFHCQEAVARRLRIDEAFRKSARRYLHLTRPEEERQVKTGNPSKSMKAGGRR